MAEWLLDKLSEKPHHQMRLLPWMVMAYLLALQYVKHEASRTDGLIPVIEVQADVHHQPPRPPRMGLLGLGELSYHPCLALGHALQLVKETEHQQRDPVGLQLGEGDLWLPDASRTKWRIYDWREVGWQTRTWSGDDWAEVGLREPGRWAIAEMERHDLRGTDRMLPAPRDPKLQDFLRG